MYSNKTVRDVGAGPIHPTSTIAPSTGSGIWLIFDPHNLFIIGSQREEMASAWSPLQVRFGSRASLRFAQGPALVDSKVKFSA